MPDQGLSNYELLTLLVALLAVLVSFLSLYRTHRTAQRQLELQEAQTAFAKFQRDLLEKELAAKQRADVRVYFSEEGRNHLLVFENKGPAAASNVDFALDIPDGQHSPLIDAQVHALLPIKRLRPGEEASMLVAITLSTVFPLIGTLRWQDEGGGVHDEECRLTL